MHKQSKLPAPTMIMYSFGQEAEGIKDAVFKGFLLFYYQQIIGLPGLWIGVALAISLCIDAVTDPIIGATSDRWSSRYGRRHPFMAASMLPLLACFILLFNPPAFSSDLVGVLWLLVFAVGVRFFMSMFSVAHLALGSELTTDPVRRSMLFNLAGMFRSAGSGGTPLFAYVLFFPTTEAFSPGTLNAEAYLPFSVFFGFAMLGFIVVSIFGTANQIPHLKPPTDNTGKDLKAGLVELIEALGNPAFRKLFTFSFTIALVFAISNVFTPFIGFHFWEITTEEFSVILLIAFPSLFVSLLVLPPLVRRFDKHHILIGASITIVVTQTWAIVARLLELSWFPENGTLWIPVIIAINSAIAGVCAPIFIAMADSMNGDIADDIELTTGQRREGVLFAARTFVGKATGSLGLVIGGALLDIIAFPENATAGTVADETIWQLGFIVGPGSAVLLLLALLILRGYPLTRHRHQEIVGRLQTG